MVARYYNSMKRGDKITILKEMCGDPPVLWKILAGTGFKHIISQPLHPTEKDRNGEIVSNLINSICGGKVEDELFIKVGAGGRS